ncbi:MAG: hypothetical protein LBQ61_02430 [Spirochaetales bacterium]|jgi:hypothetical protein|nr:hypothetical protein [Spirochaetales bacterium]
MTEVKTRAIELINRLPDDKMTYVLGILQVFEETGALETGANSPIKTGEPRGYQRLLKYRGTLNRHVDIKKEYAEALDEKYARTL